MQTKENYYYLLFVCISFYLCSIKSYPLKHNNEELRNRNSRSFVFLSSNNPTNRAILSKLSFLAKVTERHWKIDTKQKLLGNLPFI